MWTKIKLVLLLVFSAVIVFGATQSSGKNKKKRSIQQSSQQTTGQSSQTMAYSDVARPSIHKSSVDFLLNKFRTMIIDNKWPENIQGVYAAQKSKKKTNRRISEAESNIFLNQLRKYVVNPDLEEASGYRKSWFVSVGKVVARFDAVVQAANRSIDSRNNISYQRNIAKIPPLARELDELLKNPVKIPKKELEQIKERNYNRRLKEYYEKLRGETAK